MGTTFFLLIRGWRPREDEVKLGHVGRIVLERHQVVRRFPGESREYLLDLLLLLQGQLADLVVEADDGSGLDKERGAAGALVVDDALHLVLVFRLDGDAVAVPAHGYDAVLQIGGQRHIDHFTQLLVDPAARHADLAAHSSKARARFVRDVLLREDAPLDLPGQAL